MQTDFYKKIETSSAYRQSRDDNKNFILNNPQYLSLLVDIAFTISDKNHYKACWILELICEEKLALFIPFLDRFCETISTYENDSAIRSISKICLFLSKNKGVNLSNTQEEKIIETCLDWLIQEEKVASKAYAIRALFNFSKKYFWLKETLINILTQDYTLHSAAYKAVAKEILKKLNC